MSNDKNVNDKQIGNPKKSGHITKIDGYSQNWHIC